MPLAERLFNTRLWREDFFDKLKAAPSGRLSLICLCLLVHDRDLALVLFVQIVQIVFGLSGDHA